MLIPKGADVFANPWYVPSSCPLHQKQTPTSFTYRALGRDPEYFPDPEKFNPQRWFDGDGKLRDDLRLFSFGNGRRVCPGQHMATACVSLPFLFNEKNADVFFCGCRSVFLNTALMQWAFTISEDKEHPIDDLAFTPSANTHPLPFSVRFAPRVAPSMAGVRELLEDYAM